MVLAVKCPFCLGDGKKTKEHILSKPICHALGVDRGMTITSVDSTSQAVGESATLTERTIRLPCESCNSGWMSRLEVDTAKTLRRWLASPNERLTKAGHVHLVRWLAKTSFILGYSEGDSRRFLETPTETVVPDITTGLVGSSMRNLPTAFPVLHRSPPPPSLTRIPGSV